MTAAHFCAVRSRTSDAAATREVLVAPDRTTTIVSGSAPSAPESSPLPQRVVTISAASPTTLVVDPLGRANGLQAGRVLAQTPGARVVVEDGAVVVTLPDLPDGPLTTTVDTRHGAVDVVTGRGGADAVALSPTP